MVSCEHDKLPCMVLINANHYSEYEDWGMKITMSKRSRLRFRRQTWKWGERLCLSWMLIRWTLCVGMGTVFPSILSLLKKIWTIIFSRTCVIFCVQNTTVERQPLRWSPVYWPIKWHFEFGVFGFTPWLVKHMINVDAFKSEWCGGWWNHDYAIFIIG